MKIALVFDQFLFGGIERVGINHIKLLKKMGHEIDAFILNPKTEKLVTELEQECKVKVVPFSRKSCPDAYWNITRKLKVGKYVFPVVYLIVSFWKLLLKSVKKQRKQYDLAIAFSGHINDLTFVADNFLRANKKAAWLHGALYQYILMNQGFENLYRKIENLAVLVEDAQEEVFMYHRKNGFDFNVKKVYNCITVDDRPVDESYVKELKDKYGDFVLMASRMLYPHKDHYTVIKAFAILKEKYGINKKLVLVGDGPEKDKLISYVKQLKLEDNVVFEGSKSNVQDYYKAASVLVHASVAGEGLPTVLIEAMGMGIPVVCTDSKVGPREIIGDNKYGFLTNVQDSEDMAEKLNNLLSNDNVYNNYVEMGKFRYKDFSPSAVSEQLTGFIEGLR